MQNPPGIVLLSELADSEALRQAIAPTMAHMIGLIADQLDVFDWPEFEENTACGICHLGQPVIPKGFYSHRSTVLHAMQVAISFSSILREGQRCFRWCRFHVNAWGLPYTLRWWGPHLFFTPSSGRGKPV